MKISPRQRFRDFDPMTCLAAAVGVVFLAVIVAAGLREDFRRQERMTDANTIYRTDEGRTGGPQTQPSGRGAATGPAGAKGATVQDDDGRTGHLARLFAAIRQVESGGRTDAVGDRGRSLGAYQISLVYWRDAGGKAGDYRRLVTNNAACEQIMRAYWKKYHAVTDEQKARMHNGGPAGMKKAATVWYWNKVKEAMK